MKPNENVTPAPVGSGHLVSLGAGLLSQPKPFTGPRTRIHVTTYPKDVFPPEYSAQVWTSETDQGHYHTLGDFASREEAQAALDAHQSNKGAEA